MKKAILLLIPLFAVSLVLAKGPGPAPQKPAPPPGPPSTLPAPASISVTVGDTDITCEWEAVDGAAKYALEVCLVGTATISGEAGNPIDVLVKVKISTGTTETTATVAVVDEIAKALGVEVDAIITVDAVGVAKVKALNPGKGAGPQCNPFAVSDPFDFDYSAE